MLEVKELTLSYDGKHDVLDGLDFMLNPKEIVIIGGPTGCGKSTLAHCLTGFIRSKPVQSFSGTLEIDGDTILEQDLALIAKKIALVQQDPESQICTLKVIDEVAFGPENFSIPSKHIESIVSESLESVDALSLIDRSTDALSGGERQRVVIASMLASTPDYLILDEPTSNIDPKGILHLKELLLKLRNSGMGILCIEHNIKQLHDVADRLLLLRDGKLAPVPLSDIPTPTFSLPNPSNHDNLSPLLSAQQLTFSYGPNTAVDDVSVDFYPGEIVALMGDNGSGKTTLLSLLSGLLSPSRGQVYLQGMPIKSIPREDISRVTSVVFQNPNHQIFERTVWKDQILAIDLLGLDSESYLVKAEQLLSDVGLGDKKNQNPFSLSYGQKRRLNITSTGFYDSRVHLFDEPFIGQDIEGIEFISKLVHSYQEQDRVSIISTHDSQFAVRACTRIVFMQNGSILVDGKPNAVLKWLNDNGESQYYAGGGLE